MATIDNANYGAVVRGTSNEDSIRNAYAYDVTIQALAGNDKISLGAVGNLIQYASGDGKDSIFGFNESDTLTITGGKYSTQVSGNDVIVKVGKGSIRLVEAKGKTLNINSKKSTDIITLTKNADTLENNLDGVRIKARGGNNSVDNGGDSVTIQSSSGKDFFINNSVDSGAGDDLIFNNSSSKNSTIFAGAGNDSIGNSSSYVTISGGVGNDTINNGTGGFNVLYKYNSGDGNDNIIGFDATSTLSITGTKYSTKKSDDNVILTVDKGKITLKGAANLATVTQSWAARATIP